MAEEERMTQQQYTQLRQATSYYKSSEAVFEMEQAWIWQDDAACAFLPPSMFEVALRGDPIAEGLSEAEIEDLNSANLEAAKKVCSACPVWHLCYSSAEPEDFEFTVRAGLDPISPQEKPPIKGAETLGKTCKRGHDEWVKRADSDKHFCRACKREQERKRGGFNARRDPSKDKCKYGHFDWGSYVEKGDGLRVFCKTCRAKRRKGQDPGKVVS